MFRVWFGSVRACAVGNCVSSYRSCLSNQKIEFAIDLITGGLVAHAHALQAALAASVPANYFFWGFPK